MRNNIQKDNSVSKGALSYQKPKLIKLKRLVKRIMASTGSTPADIACP
jgi:hypothetical protein